MNKTIRILEKRGRITIPYETRMHMGFKANDVISFEEQGDNTIIIRREKICDGCRDNRREENLMMKKPTNETTLYDFLDELPESDRRAALVHLIVEWARSQDK